jgi:tetratricopeptide (TPR) repeat protein
VNFAREEVYRNKQIEQYEQAILPTEMAKEFLNGKRDFKYDLYRVPFNNGRGGKAKPVPGASNNGMSNFFPKISPDGKWMVFTQAKIFMLLQPDSRLYIMPADGGLPREMTCNTKTMNSWHSWSPNSRWLVFASKPHGPYTKLYLTHVDENGNDTPPVLLENFDIPKRAINIPEFVNLENKNWTKIVENFMEESNYYIRVADNEAHFGNFGKAMEAYNKAIQLAPGDPKILSNVAVVKYRLNDYEGALTYLDRALSLNQNDIKSFGLRGAIKAYLNDFRAHFERANSNMQLKDIVTALDDYNNSIQLNSKFGEGYFYRGIAKIKLGDKQGGCSDLNQALSLGYEEARNELKKNCQF